MGSVSNINELAITLFKSMTMFCGTNISQWINHDFPTFKPTEHCYGFEWCYGIFFYHVIEFNYVSEFFYNGLLLE